MTESSDRLDRIERIVESNSRAIESWANETAIYRRQAQERDSQLDTKLQQLTNTVDRLANIVLRINNRQDDHEDRINRLEQGEG